MAKELRQVPFQSKFVEVGDEDVQHDILSVFTPDDGQWVYTVDTLEEGEYKMLTPGDMEGSTIKIKHSFS